MLVARRAPTADAVPVRRGHRPVNGVEKESNAPHNDEAQLRRAAGEQRGRPGRQRVPPGQPAAGSHGPPGLRSGVRGEGWRWRRFQLLLRRRQGRPPEAPTSAEYAEESQIPATPYIATAAFASDHARSGVPLPIRHAWRNHASGLLRPGELQRLRPLRSGSSQRTTPGHTSREMVQKPEYPHTGTTSPRRRH